MKIIYGSKLYKASSHKNKIRAAINNPDNAELVKQLSSYLDKEYRSLAHKQEVEVPEMVEQDVPGPSRDEGFSGGGGSFGGGFSGGGSFGGGSFGDDSLTDDLEDAEDALGDDDFEPMDDPEQQDYQEPIADEPVQEAADIPDESNVDLITSKLTEIRDSLESDPELDNIGQIRVKGDELWIFYKDSVNLNTIMEKVITHVTDMNNGEFDFLSFNRLARSDNAIVFEITEK